MMELLVEPLLTIFAIDDVLLEFVKLLPLFVRLITTLLTV
jgi:hypothetical protein